MIKILLSQAHPASKEIHGFRTLGASTDLGVEAYRLGRAVADPERKVYLPNGLVGQGNNFRRVR